MSIGLGAMIMITIMTIIDLLRILERPGHSRALICYQLKELSRFRKITSFLVVEQLGSVSKDLELPRRT